MPETRYRPRRSMIFAPGDKPRMCVKALDTGADMVCIDLEDAVAPDDKDAARDGAVSIFRDLDPRAAGPETLVRINSLHSLDGLKDVAALADLPSPPAGFMLAKVKSLGEVAMLDDVLSEAGAASVLHVMIETNEALDQAFEIARSSRRVGSLIFGAIDMAADLRTTIDWENLLFARSRVVHAAAGAGIDLIDVPWLDLEDMDGLRDEARRCSSLGFTGKAAIHPKQIPVLNETFSPAAEEVARAREIIAAFEAGDGGLVVHQGKLIEKPVLRSMQRIVAIADAQ